MTSTVIDRVYGESSGVAVKAPCVAASVAPLSLVGLGAVGSYAPQAGDRILVKDQTDPIANGIYVASVTAWKRSGDFDGSYDCVQGTLIVVYYPNGYATMFQLTTPNPIIGTTSLLFSSFVAPGSAVIPPTPAEIATGVPIPNPTLADLRRYGITPNSTGAAAANTAALIALTDPTKAGPTGVFEFAPILGSDTYHFNSQTDLRPGMHFKLNGCKLKFTKALTAADNFRGFINCLTDNSIENGEIDIAVTGGGLVNAGAALRLGSRSGYPFGAWPAGVYDQDTLVANNLPLMGNITLRNLTISSNNPAGNCQAPILAFGGLRNCLFENIRIDGQGIVPSGFIYEFGFASQNGAPGDETQWTSSHACNLIFNNWHCQHLNTGVAEGYGIELGGAHHAIINNLIVDHAFGFFNYYVGEAMSYRAWSPTDLEGVKKGIYINGGVGTNLVGPGLILSGAANQFGGYLAGVVIPDAKKVGLMSFEVSGVAISAATVGLEATGPLTLRNSRFDGVASGGQVILGDDCDRFSIDNCEFVNSVGGHGIRGSIGSFATTPTTLTAGNATLAAPFNGMVAGEAVYFAGSMASVTGLTAGTIYYVLASGLTSAAFKVAATPGGSAIVPGGSGTASPTVAPARRKSGTVQNCLLAGNSGGDGALWSMCACVTMIANRVGYDITMDGVAETVQANGIVVSYTSNGGTVVCDGNRVSTNSGTAYAASGTPLFGVMDIRNPKGEVTFSGVVDLYGVGQGSAGTLGTAASYPNAFGKYAGKHFDTTGSTNRTYIAQGSAPTDHWVPTDGSSSVNPA